VRPIQENGQKEAKTEKGKGVYLRVKEETFRTRKALPTPSKKNTGKESGNSLGSRTERDWKQKGRDLLTSAPGKEKQPDYKKHLRPIQTPIQGSLQGDGPTRENALNPRTPIKKSKA